MADYARPDLDPSPPPLTADERRWWRRVRKLIEEMPPGLWLFADGDLNLMRRGHGGQMVRTEAGGVDESMSLDAIKDGCEGGAW
jgi:hypothetical protein